MSSLVQKSNPIAFTAFLNSFLSTVLLPSVSHSLSISSTRFLDADGNTLPQRYVLLAVTGLSNPDGTPLDVCSDSGIGSTPAPFLCPYGSQMSQCGPRVDVKLHGYIVSDDSCAAAYEDPLGPCSDGGPGTEFVTDADGAFQTLCAYGTDPRCPLRFAVYGAESYSASGLRAPNPLPPPTPPSPPPPRPPPFAACADDCSQYGTFEQTLVAFGLDPSVEPYTSYVANPVCSDGGQGARALLISGLPHFVCDYGHQCSLCNRRTETKTITADVQFPVAGELCPELLHNDQCDDTLASPDDPCALGYGEDEPVGDDESPAEYYADRGISGDLAFF